MDNMNILPLADPDITVYPIFANPLSILQLHNEAEGYLMNSFIQLCTNHEALNFYDFNYKLCPFLKVQRISQRFINNMGYSLHEFLLKSIDNGFYPYLLIGMRQIPLYRYNGEFTHDIFVNGYDEKEKVYYVSDNFVNGKYSRQKCSYNELENAIEDISDKFSRRLGFRGMIELIEFDKEETTKFSISRLKNSLLDYINGRATTEWNVIEYRNCYEDSKKRWLYGIDCYSYLKERLESIKHNTELQDYHLLWEHKKHMLKILEYVYKSQYIGDNQYIEIYRKMTDACQKAMIVRNLLIKYKLNSDDSILKRSGEYLDLIKASELECIELFIKELNNY